MERFIRRSKDIMDRQIKQGLEIDELTRRFEVEGVTEELIQLNEELGDRIEMFGLEIKQLTRDVLEFREGQ